MVRGTFLVVEGTDRSGKDTQVAKLVERLEREGYEVARFDFPQYDKPSSYFIHEYQNGTYGSDEEVGPYTGSLFYALDRYQAAPAIRSAIEDGKVVIANRFTGSNMAHQGTKFAQSEHRRGYFIWLDNLEYEMLKIPRPDRSIVLRVPSETSQPLVEVYDDLCQLFPKDFIRIDCSRGKKLLDDETIHTLLWQTIEPLLPPKSDKKSNSATTKPSSVSLDHTFNTKHDNDVKQPSAQHHVSLNISSLLAGKLEANYSIVPIKQAWQGPSAAQNSGVEKYTYYVPKDLDAKTKATYVETMDRIFNLHSELVEKTTAYIRNTSSTPKEQQDDVWLGKTSAEAINVTQTVLPVAITSTIDVLLPDQTLENMLLELISDNLPEAHDVGKQILTESHTVVPARLKNFDTSEKSQATIAYKANTRLSIQELAGQFLPDNHSSETDPVTLTSVWPRNELDLLPDMLYEHSNVSLTDLETEVATWPIARRMDIFEEYIGKRLNKYDLPGKALEKACYSWDLLCDYATFRDLQHTHKIGLTNWQLFTPRYGYEIPQLFEDASLTDLAEECFDLSLQLYSTLQSAGFTIEAQYATLFGHRMRWKMTHNAREAIQLFEHSSRPATQKLLHMMYERLGEAHPMIASAMKFVNKD